MISSWKKGMMRAGLVLLASCLWAAPARAAPIESVAVRVASTDGYIPPQVESRISASISSIGNRVLVGKEENLFRLNSASYNKVLADIINRVVVGYVVSDLSVDYGSRTTISAALTPVGAMIRNVETEINYGSLSQDAADFVKQDTEGVPVLMGNLLVGLPVDSVGWAQSVSESAGKDMLDKLLPEFTANFEVESGETTKVRIFLIPKGPVVRTGKVTFRRTTIPRLFMLRAVTETESAMRKLEGLPVAFVQRHRDDLAAAMGRILSEDSFIKKYEIETHVELLPGEVSDLKIDALTDHWIIRTEAWLDAGRDGNKNTAIEGMLGHFMGRNNVIFGEARIYPGPMDWNVYGGWYHHWKRLDLGYKYDFVEDSNHVFAYIPINERMTFRYDRDFGEQDNEYGLSYKLFNYMTLEYVYNDDDGKWVRLIANL